MKTVLITGSNKGIGYAIAKKMQQAGNQVIVTARNLDRAKAASDELSKLGTNEVGYVQLDLTDETSVNNAINEIKSNYPKLDLLINNAGISGDFSNQNLTINDLKETMQVNFFGTFQLIQGLVDTLTKNNGRIINLTIPLESVPFWNPLAYKTSKAAQNMMTTSMAIDFKQNNQSLEIFSVNPGPTTTDLNGHMEGEGFNLPDDVAAKFVPLALDQNDHQGEILDLFPMN